MQIIQDRRTFLAGLTAAGTAGLIGTSAPAWAEPPPETATIRLPAVPAACMAPLYLAKDLLLGEGFAEVRYVPTPIISAGMVADGEIDVSLEACADFLPLVDVGRPLTILSGVHVGCMELRAKDSIKSIGDLRGTRVGVSAIGAADHLLVSAMASYVGVDPGVDIKWVTNSSVSQADLFTAGEIDAFIGAPPEPSQPCMRNVGHVVVNTAHDRPWSNYFCCMVTANADFVSRNPVATKRMLRAILKATDICHTQSEIVARRMADVGFAPECALTILKDARYGLWREYDPEDTVRFFTLRLSEVRMIKKTPKDVISNFTDWRFLNELRREMKT